ncbi:MAG: hypothetical protein WEC79_02515 [Thermomicrobiales bacterium]
MATKAILHISGEESILCEIETMPLPSDNFVVVFNPTRKDGKPIPTLENTTTSVIFPWTRVSYIELFEERSQRESVVGFFRESDGRRGQH